MAKPFFMLNRRERFWHRFGFGPIAYPFMVREYVEQHGCVDVPIELRAEFPITFAGAIRMLVSRRFYVKAVVYLPDTPDFSGKAIFTVQVGVLAPGTTREGRD